MKRFFRRLTAFLLILLLTVTSASALTVDEALELLDRYFVYEIPEEARNAETLDELFALLGDRYTCYMTAEEYDSFLRGVEGVQELVGIGVSVRLTADGIYVDEVLAGGSALSAGIRAGDLIVEVDGVSCVPADDSHRAMIAGEEGTLVALTVVREGVAFRYTLPRWRVVVPNTEFDLVDGSIGWIDCNSFGSDTGISMMRGISAYEGLTDAWVLDLRGNSGGYTDAAITMLGLFSGPGVYLYLRDRGGLTQGYVYSDPVRSEDPLVVLVDGSSASASEAVAAGIRDSGRGIVIGKRTFGKGVAQIVMDGETDPLLFGEDALKVTAYRFYSQGTNTTDLIGVIPMLELDSSVAEQVARALCGRFRDDLSTDGQLMLRLAGQYFFLDMEDLPSDAASAFLSALPPGAQLWVGSDGFMWKEIDPADAAELLGAEYAPRRFDDVADSPYAFEINTLAN